MIVFFLFFRTKVIQKTFLNLLCITRWWLTTLHLLWTGYLKMVYFTNAYILYLFL